MKTPLKATLAALCITGLGITTAHAGLITYTTDNFGSGANAFSIQFVHVGNAGNGNDANGFSYTADGGLYGSNATFGLGGVSYNYRIGVAEVPQDWIDKATNLGMTNVTAGAWTGNQPAANMEWYEAAAFVNYLNTITGHQAAYNLTWTGTAWTMGLWSGGFGGQAWQAGGENRYRHKDSYYFLPSEDEWYKAAHHKNDGVTANYWDWATASNSIPDGIDISGDTAFDAVFHQGFTQAAPNAVTNVGLASAYGTVGQNGNVAEWMESAHDGLNNSSSEGRVSRGGSFVDTDGAMRSSNRPFEAPTHSTSRQGLRVASIEPIPEPTGILTGLLCLGLAALRRRAR